MKNILNNQNGHGYAPSLKDLLKIAVILITAPIHVPVMYVVKKIKGKK